MNTRKTAFDIIYKTVYETSYSNLLLRDRLNEYNDLDKSFITNLVYGVLKNYDYLKYQLHGLYDKTSKTNEIILIMSLYEKFILNKEDYITVNEYVNLAKNEYDKSFINAILHKIDKINDTCSEDVKYSLPLWIYKLLKAQYDSKDLTQILNNYHIVSKTYYHINHNKCSFDDLKKYNINIINNNFFTSVNTLTNTDEFKNGYFYIQDINSSYIVDSLSLNKGDLFLDACSAPGSKLFNALCYINDIDAYCNDINLKRVNLIKQKASILGFNNIHYLNYDAKELSKFIDIKFDKILLDVPCSGIGVIGRRPDIKFHLKDKNLDELEIIQSDILEDVSKLLKDNGLLCYSTCTLNKKENTKQVQNFINKHNNFIIIKEETIINDDTDMFYYAVIKKI